MSDVEMSCSVDVVFFQLNHTYCTCTRALYICMYIHVNIHLNLCMSMYVQIDLVLL